MRKFSPELLFIPLVLGLCLAGWFAYAQPTGTNTNPAGLAGFSSTAFIDYDVTNSGAMTLSSPANGLFYFGLPATPKEVAINGSAVQIQATGVLQFMNGTFSGGSVDTGMSRDSAATVDIGNGNPGDSSGTIKAARATLTTLAQAGPGDYVCYNTSTGVLNYEPTANTCTVSAARFKNLEREITPDEGFNVMVHAVGYKYTYKDPTEHGAGEHFGFTADQVATVDRDLVSFESDGQTHAVKYGEMLPFVAAAFQKMQQEIRAQQQEIAELKARIGYVNHHH